MGLYGLVLFVGVPLLFKVILWILQGLNWVAGKIVKGSLWWQVVKLELFMLILFAIIAPIILAIGWQAWY